MVLATTLEYVSLPPDVYADVLARSSYNRLGVNASTSKRFCWTAS